MTFKDGGIHSSVRTVDFPDGARYFEITASPLKNSRGEIVAGIEAVRDITGRTRNEEALRTAEAKLRAAVNSLPFDFWMCGRNGRYNMQNPVSINHWGNVIGKSPHEADVGEDVLSIWLENNRRAFGGETVDEEVKIELNGRETVFHNIVAPIADQGGIHGILGINIDITERKMTELALKESQERFKTLADSLPQTVYEADVNGKLTYVNAAAFDVFGYTREDFENGLNVVQMIVPEERARAVQKMRERAEGLPGEDLEYTAMRKDGSTFSVSVHSSAIVHDGEVTGLRGILVDISERKRMDAELAKAQKLESIGVLAGGIAHDFNNILSAVIGNVSLVLTQMEPGGMLHGRLREAEKASMYARDLTRQLLTFAKGGAPVRIPLSVERLIRDAVAFSTRGVSVQCDVSIAAGLRAVEADQGQIGQALNNLLINACQAMPDGGTIRIKAENVTGEMEDVRLPAGGSFVKITVSDEGVGIAPDVINKIFDPYFTTKQRGSGLGLAVTYSVIKNHGGNISVKSEPGSGTTFTMYLPASDKEAGEGHDDQKRMLPGTGKILFMDDEEMLRNVAGAIMTHLGYEAEFASEGSEAIAKFIRARQDGRQFDAVILDLTIPGGMGGREVAERIREIDPEVKLIVSSGYSDDRVMSNFREYGFDDILVKPYKSGEMSRVLNAVIGRGKTVA
jgi:PAS domain S-box-containing protein